MTHRVHNFGAGPGALPLEVLQKAQEELLDFAGEGMSIMEMSHRSKTYENVHDQAIADLRALLGIGDDYEIIFMGGGARTQFALVAMNLLGEKGFGEYLVTGSWSEGAVKEAKKIGEARVLYDSKASNHDHVPGNDAYAQDIDADYLHYTSNNTIFGTQFHHIPQSGDVPLVCDMSSDILSRPVDVSRFGLIYAGAQKNMGPAGVTVVIIRKDILERSGDHLPEMFNYKKIAAKNSMLNTPPVFPIYMLGLVAKHVREAGGVEAMAKVNEEKANLVYEVIDGAPEFFKAHAREDSRSRMNVTFRLPSEELEAAFVAEAKKNGLIGLKGHRSVGGIRASIYNATGVESVQALTGFMRDFAASNG